MNHDEIASERRKLALARRDRVRQLMGAFDASQRQQIKALQEQCAAIGHKPRHTGQGPLGNLFYHCAVCGLRMPGDERLR